MDHPFVFPRAVACLGALLLPCLLGGCDRTRVEVRGLASTLTGGAPVARGGAARVDITPPLGKGLGGHGPNGLRAMGTRGRLECQVLYLAAPDGASLAWATCDLPFVSTATQRRAVELIAGKTEDPRCKALGADNLLVSATHTHAGPSGIWTEGTYSMNPPVELDGFVPPGVGYDPVLAEWVADRIATGVVEACAGAKDGVEVAWMEREVTRDFSRNRSVLAHCANPDPLGPGTGCAATPVPRQEVSHHLSVLGVWSGDALLAAWSFFPIHPTAVPNGNDVYHADLFGAARRELQARRGAGTVFGFVNGAEGDVSPAWPGGEDRSGAGFELADAVGTALAEEVIDALAAEEHGLPAPPGPEAGAAARAGGHRPLQIQRAQADVPLAGGVSPADPLDPVDPEHSWCGRGRPMPDKAVPAGGAPAGQLCPRGALGFSATAGAEDGPTAYRYSELGFAEGQVAPSDDGCHAEKALLVDDALLPLIKRRFLLPLSELNIDLDDSCAFPEVVPLGIYRIAGRLVVAVPGELTTTAGLRVAAAAAAHHGEAPAVIAGLTNGYLQYVTTREEYALQQYEGGSVLYGPDELGYLLSRVTKLAELLPEPGAPPASTWSQGVRLGAWSQRPHTAPRGVQVRAEGPTVVGRAPGFHGTVRQQAALDLGGYAPIHADHPDGGARCQALEAVLPDLARDLWDHPDQWQVRVTTEDGAPVLDSHGLSLDRGSQEVELRLLPSLLNHAAAMAAWHPVDCPEVGATTCLEVRPSPAAPGRRVCAAYTGPGWSRESTSSFPNAPAPTP